MKNDYSAIEQKLQLLSNQIEQGQTDKAQFTARDIYEELLILNYLNKTKEDLQEVLFSDKQQALSYTDEGFELKADESKESKTINEVFSINQPLALNDRIAFINHLFLGDEKAFISTLQQINDMPYDEACRYLDEHIKPLYDNWEGKAEYERRFAYWISKK